MALQYKSQQVGGHSTLDGSCVYNSEYITHSFGPGSIQALSDNSANSNLGTKQGIRTFDFGWPFSSTNVRALPQYSSLIATLTFAIPADPGSSWTTAQQCGVPNSGRDANRLLAHPWSPSPFPYNFTPDISFSPVSAQSWSGNGAYSSSVMLAPGSWAAFCFVDSPLTLTAAGENKIRSLIQGAKSLWNDEKILTYIEVGNELNFAEVPHGPNGEQKYGSWILSVPMTPAAQADLLYEVIRVANEPANLGFPSSTIRQDGRIPIILPSGAPYVGMGELYGGHRAVTWQLSRNPRNPFHPDRPSSDPNRQEIGSPDRRFIWETLDSYRIRRGSYPSIDGFAFHLYIDSNKGTNHPHPYRSNRLGLTFPTAPNDAWSLRQAYRGVVNDFLYYVGNPAFAFSLHGDPYPASYGALPVFATETSYVGTTSELVVKDAYDWTLYYYNVDFPNTPPQNRLRMINFYADDQSPSTANGNCGPWRDRLVVKHSNSNCLLGSSYSLATVGAFHKGLTSTNPGEYGF